MDLLLFFCKKNTNRNVNYAFICLLKSNLSIFTKFSNW